MAGSITLPLWKHKLAATEVHHFRLLAKLLKLVGYDGLSLPNIRQNQPFNL
jgi:hypothetical protein